MAGGRTLLLPVDDDDLSEAVFAHVLKSDEVQEGDTLHLLHVILPDPSSASPSASIPSADYFDQADPEAERRAERAMLQRRFLSRLPAPRVREVVAHIVKASLDPATVGAVIVDHAHKLGAAKIVMAAHPHSKVAVFFGASVVSHCQAHAPCPVLALREADLTL